MAGKQQEVKIVAREMVKPSSPTPPHLSRFNFSLLDQMIDANVLVPMIWFYSGTGNMNFSQICAELKSSLSRTLSLFYPFAGRIRNPSSIDCCDDGVEFVEAELNCPMIHFSGSVLYPDSLQPLVPGDLDPFMQMMNNRKMEYLCVIQATLFDCGGVAICVCLSHKIADAVTFISFVKAWATIASESGPVESPDLGLASLLPPFPEGQKPLSVEVDGSSIISGSKVITRRLFFSASKTEELKARGACGPVVGRPTRVEAVTGLIWKCAAAANRSTTNQSSAVCVSADLRRKLAPFVSENTVGNLLGMVLATSETTDEMNISNQVTALRKSMEVFSKRFQGKAITASLLLELEGDYAEAMRMDMYRISSLCGVPIYFDFGWGRAKLVTPIVFAKNMVLLMDMEDLRGVQALVTLEEQEMRIFEKDQHLLSFASFTPPHVPNPRL